MTCHLSGSWAGLIMSSSNMTFIWKAMKSWFLDPQQTCKAHLRIAEGLGTNRKYHCIALSLKHIYAGVNVSLQPIKLIVQI